MEIKDKKKDTYYTMSKSIIKMLANKSLLPNENSKKTYIEENLYYDTYCNKERNYCIINIKSTNNNEDFPIKIIAYTSLHENNRITIDVALNDKKISIFDNDIDIILERANKYLWNIANNKSSYKNKILKKIDTNNEKLKKTIKKIQEENDKLRELLK